MGRTRRIQAFRGADGDGEAAPLAPTLCLAASRRSTSTRIANYQLIAGECGLFDSHHAQPIPIASISDNSATFAVRITTRTKLDIDDPTQVILKGATAKGIAGIDGLRLDGKGNGGSGSNFTAVVRRDVLVLDPRPHPLPTVARTLAKKR